MNPPDATRTSDGEAAWATLAARAAAGDPLGVLRADQVARWSAGDAVPAEEYLRRFPALDPDDALVLVVAEAGLRRERGEEPQLNEFRARFPRFAADLDVQFALLAHLGTAAPPPDTAGWPGTGHSASDTAGWASGEAAASGPAGAFGVPGYEVLGELGAGAMGVVYRARDVRLNRPVALKTVAPRATAAAVARFWAEAEVMAAVEHPNVVQVYELGEHAGAPYLAMEYVPGGDLAGWLRGRPPVPPRAAAALVGKLARGVAAAHALGVVHRDLKPGNVLLAGPPDAPEPKVADFGLAKRRTHDLTRTQALMGTPAYMSPEQAVGRAKFVGPPADVWALGVILYECVAGEKPFAGDTLEALLTQIRSAEPRELRGRVRGLPRDLGTVVAKCLAKEPEHRYPTAAELADDLARFARGEPTAARPVGAAERAVRWARREPARAAAYSLTGLAAALAAVAVVVLFLWRDAEGARATAQGAQATAEDARDDARRSAEAADAARRGETAAKAEVERQRRLLERINYGRTVQVAHSAYLDHRFRDARELLRQTPSHLRGWEYDYVHRLCHADRLTIDLPIDLPDEPIERLADSITRLSPDGTKVLAVGVQSFTPRVWDAATGATVSELKGHTGAVHAASFSPDGTRVLTAGRDRTARIWEARTGAQVVVLAGHTETIGFATFSPDGERVLTVGEDAARVWSAGTGRLLSEFKVPPPGLIRASFSPDGSRVLTFADNGHTARVWDAATGKPIAVLAGHTEPIRVASFSPDGTRAATGSSDRTARVWDVGTGKSQVALVGHASAVSSLSFSPDGHRVLTASESDRTARVWDAATGKPVSVLAGHTGDVLSASFSPDSKGVATGSADRTARVCDAATGALVAVLAGHEDWVSSAMFSGDGARVLTVGYDRTARVWDAGTGKSLAVLAGHTDGNTSASFNQAGTRVLTGSNDGTARVWDVDQPLTTLAWETPAFAWSFRVYGLRAAARSYSGVVRVWDATTAAAVAELDGAAGIVERLELSPNGTRVLTWGTGNTAQVWDAATGKSLVVLTGHTKELLWALFSPDGGRVLTMSEDDTVRVWDAVTGRPLAVLADHATATRQAWFSPDGTRVLTWGSDATARVWDAASGTLAAELIGHTGVIRTASFSPDGTQVLTGSDDRTARVWDAGSGKPMAELTGHTNGVYSVEFGRNGAWVLTVSKDGTVRVWNAVTGQPATVLSYPTEIIACASLSPDGSRVLTTSVTGGTRVSDAATGAELLRLPGGMPGFDAASGFSPDGGVVWVASKSGFQVYDARPVNRAFAAPEAAPAPRPARQ